jgi:hypothetical protein
MSTFLIEVAAHRRVPELTVKTFGRRKRPVSQHLIRQRRRQLPWGRLWIALAEAMPFSFLPRITA